MRNYEDLQRQFSEGRIGRRDFIKRATALGLAAAVPSALLAEEAIAAAPKRGGKLRQALRGGSTSDTLFGVLGGGDTHQVNTQWQILSNLTEVGADGEVVGELAENWEVNGTATQWVFNLRKGVEFHNGKSLEAQDVIDSINVHRGEDSKSTGKGSCRGHRGYQAPTARTGWCSAWKSGNADFPDCDSPARDSPLRPAGSTRCGLGQRASVRVPYILSEWEPGVRSATKRNPNYFKEGKPYFDEVETLHIADVTARTSALQTGARSTPLTIQNPRPFICLEKSVGPLGPRGGRQQPLHLPHADGHGTLRQQRRTHQR